MSGFQVNFGRKADGTIDYRTVPCTYGDPTRQAAQILRANSTNTTITVPQISCYITEMKYARERVQDPTYVKTVSIIQRATDPVTGSYIGEPGNKFTVDRLMPVPFDLVVKADIWCSNTDQKLQLLEQIGTQFNPSMEIQGTDNFLDWTSLSYINLDDLRWSSRSVPMGNDDQIDVATMTFSMPIWLSSPAKVKKLGVITNIITTLYDGNGQLRSDLSEQGFQASDFLFNNELANGGSTMNEFANPAAQIRVGIGYDVIVLDSVATLVQNKSLTTLPSQIDFMGYILNNNLTMLSGELPLGSAINGPGVTPNTIVTGYNSDGTYQINISQVLGSATAPVQLQGFLDQGVNGTTTVPAAEVVPWDAAISLSAVNFQDGATRLFLDQGTGVEVAGIVSTIPGNSSQLMFAVEDMSTPSNTLPAVNRIINPLESAPGHGLPSAANGQRYLILHDIGNNMNARGAEVWRGVNDVDLVASQYDIIQYNGTQWVVSFRAKGTTALQYVTNLANGQQFKWTGTDWLRSWEGLYTDGYWRLE